MTTIELGETSVATDLVPGSPESLRATARGLARRSTKLDQLAREFRGLDLSGIWEGDAARSFMDARLQLEPAYESASDADRGAADALRAFASVLEDAQQDAARAITIWERGHHAGVLARRHWDAEVAQSGGPAVSSPRSLPRHFVDPGDSERAAATRILELARSEVRDAGDRAARAVRESEGIHEAPTFWDSAGDAAGGAARVIGNGFVSLANAAVEHPDEYWSMVLGVLGMVGGGAAEVGGGALDATGAGAPAGVAINVASAGLIVAGSGLTAESAGRLVQHALTDSRVDRFTNESAGGTESDGNRAGEIVEEAARGSDDFGLGSGTMAEADEAGFAWVGEDFTVSGDGKAFISKDGLRVWRPPAFKKRLGKWQSNFETRLRTGGRPDSNGHLDITDGI